MSDENPKIYGIGLQHPPTVPCQNVGVRLMDNILWYKLQVKQYEDT